METATASITPSKTPKFYTKDGWLTPYALGCCYIEQLSKDGDPYTHVTLEGIMADKLLYVVGRWSGYKRVEETYRTIGAARRAFREMCKIQDIGFGLPTYRH